MGATADGLAHERACGGVAAPGVVGLRSRARACPKHRITEDTESGFSALGAGQPGRRQRCGVRLPGLCGVLNIRAAKGAVSGSQGGVVC
eukprot:364284-Chlamydomonas_euryale.AAC.10